MMWSAQNQTEEPAGKLPNTIISCLELNRNGQQSIQDDADPGGESGEQTSHSVPS